MTPRYRYGIIVISKARAPGLNQAALEWDPAGGERTLTVRLSPNGALPASHYWCGTWLRLQTWAAILNRFGAVESPADSGRYEDPAGDRLYDGTLWTAEQVLADVGLQRIPVENG